jgi:hypothetical protein
MMSGAPLPSSVLLLLTAAVLAAHVWVLQPPPRRVPAAAVVRAPAFATRRVQAPAAPAAPSRQAPPAGATPAARAKAMRGELTATAREPQAARGRDAAAPPASVPLPDAARVVVPPPAQLRYEVTAQVKQQRVQGSSALAWQHDGQHYTASFEVDVPGLPARRQTSDGQVTAAGFAPLRFGEQSRGEQAAHFERDAGRVSFSNNRPAAPLLAGAQDRLSVVLQLAALLAGDPQHARPGATIATRPQPHAKRRLGSSPSKARRRCCWAVSG